MKDTHVAINRATIVINRRGLHARAAAFIARVAGQFEAEVTVATAVGQVSALSIMGMLMLGASKGTKIQFNAQGSDAKEAVDALVHLFESGFEEG